MGRLLWLGIFVLIGALAQAQELPQAPRQNALLASAGSLPAPPAAAFIVSAPKPTLPESPHKYWDTTNKILLISHFGLEAADFGITHYNLSRGGRELNWMAKPLVERGTAGQVTFFAGRSVAVVGISYLLHKSQHHKLERAFIAAASADSAYGVVFSFAHK